MTRVYASPAAAGPGMRALLVGAGRYPHAKAGLATVPNLEDLDSVPASVLEFVKKLMTDWREDLASPLVSVDLLLSDPDQPAGAKWLALGVPGEAPAGASIDEATLDNIQAAVDTLLTEASSAEDTLLILFCGHGFLKKDRYFLPADFGSKPNSPWNRSIDLKKFSLGLRQHPPRKQWLFWDCCANIPDAVLKVLDLSGEPLVEPESSLIPAATEAHGDLSQFTLASAAAGKEAYGIDKRPSRFVEILTEAIDGAGATRAYKKIWWVHDRGIIQAVQSYVQRHPELEKPKFYRFVMPSTLDAPDRMDFRKLKQPPQSLLVAQSNPLTALKEGSLIVTDQSGKVHHRQPPAPHAVVYLRLPPLQYYTFTATFPGTSNPNQSLTEFGDLPFADTVEFDAS